MPVADIDTPFRRFVRAYLASKLAVADLVLLGRFWRPRIRTT